MRRGILVLSDELELSDEALGHAAAVTQRTEGTLVLLLLLSPSLRPDRDEEALERSGRELLEQCVLGTLREVERVEAHVRLGDPWSELCKFAALRGPFLTAVWGSRKGLSEWRRGWPSGHWANRIHKLLSCPVVTVRRRWDSDRARVDRAWSEEVKER